MLQGRAGGGLECYCAAGEGIRRGLIPQVTIVPDLASPFVIVLGTAQDGGTPQAGCHCRFCLAAISDPHRRRLPASLGIVDPVSGQRWIIDATPAFPEQLRRLDEAAEADATAPLDGILLTHAHAGHYTGLLQLGPETMASESLPVWVMPRMAGFLHGNEPWKQLIEQRHIELRALQADEPVALNERLAIIPLAVPHRDEYSETVAFEVEGPDGRVLWLPDIDSWDAWDDSLEARIDRYQAAWIDGTFHDDSELPGRDRGEIPHPTITESLERFGRLSTEQAAKLRFMHLNHSNPAADPDSAAAAAVQAAGMHVAAEGERWELASD